MRFAGIKKQEIRETAEQDEGGIMGSQVGVVAAIAMIVVVVLVLMARLGGSERISPERAHELVDGGALLLDVRTPGEFGAGHIEGAVNIPVAELASRLDELGDKSGGIVVYCRSGARSARASAILSGAGFEHVDDLGSMSRW